MTTTVCFDLDRTLLNYSTPFSELFAQTLPIEATDGMTETYSEQVLSSITQLEERPYQHAFAAVREKYNLNVDPEALAAEYMKKEATTTQTPDTVQSLVESISTQHQTGILTNGDGQMQRRKIEKHGLNELVDTIIVSNEVGSRNRTEISSKKVRNVFPQRLLTTPEIRLKKISFLHEKQGSKQSTLARPATRIHR